MESMRDQLTTARRRAGDAARYADHARDVLAGLLEQAEDAGREAIAGKLREALRHVVAAGIDAELSAGAFEAIGAYFGHAPNVEPLRFSADLGRAIMKGGSDALVR